MVVVVVVVVGRRKARIKATKHGSADAEALNEAAIKYYKLYYMWLEYEFRK